MFGQWEICNFYVGLVTMANLQLDTTAHKKISTVQTLLGQLFSELSAILYWMPQKQRYWNLRDFQSHNRHSILSLIAVKLVLA